MGTRRFREGAKFRPTRRKRECDLLASLVTMGAWGMMSPRYGVLGSVSRVALMAGVAFGVALVCADADAQQGAGETPVRVAADGRPTNDGKAAPRQSGPAQLAPIAV